MKFDIKNKLKITKENSYKIAITGLSQAGKTVFITSLIDQLLHKDKIALVTNKNFFRVQLEAPSIGMKRFDYYTFVDKIKNEHIWPKGTNEITSIKLKIQSKKSSLFKRSSFTIQIIDYPGEWLLDLSMINTSFERWCEQRVSWLENLDDEDANIYLKLLEEDSLNPNYLASKYHELLYKLKDKNYTNITPGRFIMPSDLKNDPILTFAAIKNKNATYAKIFEKNYIKYTEDIVKNIQLKYFKGFHRQIILIDVIKALQNGYKCYEDMHKGLDTIVSLYDHKKHSFLRKLFTPTIKKVIFAAGKCDLVSSSQHQNYKVLLQQMVHKYMENLQFNDIKTSSHVFAAVKSTITVKRQLQGKTVSVVRGVNSDTSQLKDHYPGEMPFSFPNADEWNAQDYNYKTMLPSKKQYKLNEAFEHINMDEIINELIGDLI